jgi:allophanate hydrolase
MAVIQGISRQKSLHAEKACGTIVANQTRCHRKAHPTMSASPGARASTDSLDLQTLQARFASGALNPESLLDDVLARADHYDDPAVWITRLSADEARGYLRRAMDRAAAGIAQPLLGIPFAIKDNIDLAGVPTTAACPAFAYVPEKSATVVQKLIDAGAIPLGKTNLDQFATGLVGTRSPYGACRNVFHRDYISGGSSSGSAVAVAAGLVSFALGTDTAGSGRVPAAFNNIVGLKPSRGLLSAAGVVPACRSLDCVSIFALNCRDAATLFEITRGCDPADPYSRMLDDAAGIDMQSVRVGVPRETDLKFFGNEAAAAIYRAAIAQFSSLGATRVEFDYAPFAQAAAMLYEGPWVAERYLTAAGLMREHPDAIHPVIRSILERAPSISALDTFSAMYRMQSLRQQALAEMARFDVMLLPTAGTIYTIAQVEADPITLNANLGYYTNFVNLFDLCGAAVPAGILPNGVPMGVTLLAAAGHDRRVLGLADTYLKRRNG